MRAVPPVDLEDWRRIEPILDEILDLEPDERSDRLASLCAGDPELRVQVEAFLAADEAAGGFLDTPAGQYASDLLAEDGEETRKPAGADLPEALRQVGPYRLLREVGSGGMGVVYEAEDTRLGRRVAIKFLPPEYNRDRKANGRFLREARAASALDHPNLCTVYDVGEYEDRLYIVLAFYEGESLRERLRRGPLPIMEAREVAIQIARGLVRAHEAGIIHRDIKPANVMLTRRGEVKILDFGVAKLGGEEASLTPTGGSWGTPAYMSPEQARGEPVDGRADIWALGVVLYEMLAGRRPFGGEGVQEVLCAILTREPGPLERLRPDVPSELARVVERALAKVPAERYASAADFLADLESGRAPKVPASFHRLRRSRGLLAISVAVVVLVLLAWALRWLTSKPLRVAVLHPSVTSANGDPELSFVSSEVVDATLDTLLYLEGIQPLDPPEKDETGGSAAELKRAAEADEVLRPLLSCRKGGCSMTLRRVRMPEGDVLRTVGPFEVETGADNAQDLAGTLRFRLQEIYEDHPLRPDAPRAKVKDEDYSDYIQLKRRFDRYGQRLGDSDLQRLDTLLQRSPDLLEGWILAADIANSIRQRVRAFNYITQAERIAPHDPRPLFTRVRIEVDEKRLEDAKETLAKLVEMAPADARVLIAQADLLEAQGKLTEARALRQELVRKRPHWTRAVDLAILELHMGESESASRRLRDVLKEQPDNVYAKENLAAIEIVFGDPKRAAALNEELVTVRPTPLGWNNLGFARLVLGDYPAAESAFRQALVLDSDYPLARFNLTAVLDARGDPAGAQHLCRALVKEFEAEPTQGDPILGLLYAQCLARLGRNEDATLLTDQVLDKWPEENIQILFRAAQLYGLLGKRSSVVHYAEKAIEKGLRREWFTFPEFRTLKDDPELRALLDSAGHKARDSRAGPSPDSSAQPGGS